MKASSPRAFAKAAFVFMLLIVAIEVVLRLALQFPLYDADNQVGYWIRPQQSGAYFFNRDWAFNSRSIGVKKEFSPGENLDVLLVGDSVVLGGNPLKQVDKLGPVMARNTGWSVWPISAGSWAMQDELAFLNRNADMVRQVDVIVFVFNSWDFGDPSSWASQVTHPRSYPKSYIWYLIQKCCTVSNVASPMQLRVQRQDPFVLWRKFNDSANVPIVVIAYPAIDELDKNCSWVPVKFREFGSWSCYNDTLSNTARDYRDNVHPSAAGNARLARFIQLAVRAAVMKRGMAGVR